MFYFILPILNHRKETNDLQISNKHKLIFISTMNISPFCFINKLDCALINTWEESNLNPSFQCYKYERIYLLDMVHASKFFFFFKVKQIPDVNVKNYECKADVCKKLHLNIFYRKICIIQINCKMQNTRFNMF